MTQERTIIVGYDGRPTVDDAVALAAELAELTQAGLVLVFAYGARATAPPSSDDWVPPRVGAQRVLRRGLARLPYGFPARVRAIPEAPAWPVLTNVAEEMGADLLVIGSTERSPAGHVMVGGVGQRLLECAPCPVAIAPRGFRTWRPHPLKRIGVCVNGSEDSAKAFQVAGALAHRARGELRIYRDGNENDATQILGKCAVEEHLHLFVVGCGGRDRLRNALLGGATGDLVQSMPCPVWIVTQSAGPDVLAREGSGAASTRIESVGPARSARVIYR
jgi:nucleotide-binding universal stress UspA family protein